MISFRRYRYYFLVLLVALPYIIARSQFLQGDFTVFLAAADYLNHHHNPYDVWLVWAGKVTDKFSYGPAFAVMLIPFTCLPPRVAFSLFFVIQILLLFRVFFVIQKMLPVNQLSNNQKSIWLLLSIMCSLRFMLHNVEFGQVTMLILFLSLEGIYQVFYGSRLVGSMLLGLGIHIKLIPIVFVPYLFWRKELRAAGLSIVFAALFWLTPFAFGDTSFVLQLFHNWLATINPLDQRYLQNQEQLPYQYQGLQALLSAYLLNSKFEHLNFKFNLAALSQPVFQFVLQASRLAFVLFTLYFLNGTFFKPYSKGARGFRELSYLFLVIPIIFPQQQKYSLLLMTPFFCYMIWWLISSETDAHINRKAIIICFLSIVLLTTFTSDLFVGMRLNYIFQCLRILTMANILAVFLLAYTRPSKTNESGEHLHAI